MTLKRFLTTFSLTAVLASSSIAQIFYKIEGNGLEKPSYLFGTHHLAPLSIIEKKNIPEYFEQVEQVVGEIDLTQDQMAMAMAMQSHMIAPSDSTLSKVISPEDFAIISEEFKNWTPMPGVELSTFDSMKPMVVSTMTTVGIMSKLLDGFDPTQQLDTYFQQQAKEQGKKISPLETLEFQASVLYDTTPISIQAEALVEMLKNPEQLIESSKKLNEAYDNEDLDAMLAISEDDDEHPEFMIALLDRRNADWLTKLPAMMAESPSFIAVGALHLAGEKGIVKGLQNLGYTVTPL